ncbi:poly(A) RNA polymerase GLD2-B-like [Liolophura sinensis]|uniref:poly(A) RNA polymerase GLD2-B-like n=1 Tax=Liolophura sinensis TaxID=3198878 RepID=UPI0031588E2E
MCQSWTILYDTIGSRACQLCLSPELKILQGLFFQALAKNCDMFPWMAHGYQSESHGHRSSEIPGDYREPVYSSQQQHSSGLHTVYDVASLSQMRHYPVRSILEHSNQRHCHASDKPVIHAQTEQHRPQQIQGYVISNVGSRFLSSSVSPVSVSEQIRTRQTWVDHRIAAQQLFQESANRCSPVNSNYTLSTDASPMPGAASHTSATRNSNTAQVFNYNHRHQEEETLKEQIRANILQQIYHSPLHHPGQRGTTTLPTHPTHSHTPKLSDLERCRDYNSELNRQADTHLREGSSSVIDCTSELHPPLSRFSHTADVHASVLPHFTSPEESTQDSHENDFNLSSLGQADHDRNPDMIQGSGLVYNQSLSSAKSGSKRQSSFQEDVGGKKKRMSDEDRKNGLKRYSPRQQNSPASQSLSGDALQRGIESYHGNGANFVPRHELPIPSRRGLSSNKDTCEQISKAIIKYFLENQQTDAVSARKMQLRDALSNIVQSVFPYSGLYIVGSSLSGFGTRKSDMDMCLMISQKNNVQKREAIDLLYALQKCLRKCSFVKNLEVIPARVPILRFRDKISDVECDLNVNNLVGIRNTHLLKHYALMDWRVRPLGLFIKYWARCQNINDARNMTISSYSFALMLIHYLQCGCAPPVLPSLQVRFPSEFNPKSDVCTLRPVTLNHHSPNDLSVGELFLGFLEYFTFTFDYRRDAISVRQGKVLPIHVVQRQTEDKRQWSCLCIEEPFELSNTARSVFDTDKFKQIQKVFRTSFMKLDKKKDVKLVLRKVW